MSSPKNNFVNPPTTIAMSPLTELSRWFGRAFSIIFSTLARDKWERIKNSNLVSCSSFMLSNWSLWKRGIGITQSTVQNIRQVILNIFGSFFHFVQWIFIRGSYFCCQQHSSIFALPSSFRSHVKQTIGVLVLVQSVFLKTLLEK